MRFLPAAIAAFFMLTAVALGQTIDSGGPVPVVPDTVVTIPYGSWVSDAFTIWGAAIASYIVFALRGMLSAFGPRVNAILLTMQADQLMARAGVYAINVVVGATKDKVWTVEVRNQVLREIVTYALVHGSAAVKAFMGRPSDIAEKGLSRIDAPTGDVVQKPSVLPDAPKPNFVQIGAEGERAAAAKGATV